MARALVPDSFARFTRGAPVLSPFSLYPPRTQPALLYRSSHARSLQGDRKTDRVESNLSSTQGLLGI